MHYFGTDGIRDIAKTLLDNNLPFLLGKALSSKGGRIIVARDVRNSSCDIEKQLCKGLLEGSASIWLAGVLPTPALAYIALKEKADYAIMITASHNPPEFNGLKVFGKCGQKLSLEEESTIDESIHRLSCFKAEDFCFIDELMCADALCEDEKNSELSISLSAQNHRIRIVDGALFCYQSHIKKMFPRFDGMKVRIDTACGCFANDVAKEVFEGLGASVIAHNNVQDGNNINVKCGSTNVDDFISQVKDDEIGFSFDGDGDRVLAVVDKKVYDGDAMLLALSTLYRIQGKLRNKFIVGTLLTNTRLQRELAYHNTALLRTPVGDKYVLDEMIKNNCLLGGENSGHILMLDKANSGDGLITALSLLEVKKIVGNLPKFSPYPTIQFNIPSSNPQNEIASNSFQQKLAQANKVSKQSRLIVRPSGTESKIRIYYECFDRKPENSFAKIKEIFGVQ